MERAKFYQELLVEEKDMQKGDVVLTNGFAYVVTGVEFVRSGIQVNLSDGTNYWSLRGDTKQTTLRLI